MDSTSKRPKLITWPLRTVKRIDWEDQKESPWWIKEGLVGGPVETDLKQVVDLSEKSNLNQPLDGRSFCRINNYERLLWENINLSEIGMKGKELIDK